ncbi:MAG: SelT/SelW/SelH family protein [Opitutaceae bacterium]
MKPAIEIEYCPGCRWLLRASWTAQELLTTFEAELGSVTLKPSDCGGTFRVAVDGAQVWDRKTVGRFPEMKELKQAVRDQIAPERDLGHSDTAERQEEN